MFSLMALAIFDCLVRTRRLARIVRAGEQLDLFDRRSFTPLARWGQSVSLIFVGGTCLSLVFQSYESLSTVRSLVIYSTMVIVSLTLFFISIWSIHDGLVAPWEARAPPSNEVSPGQEALRGSRVSGGRRSGTTPINGSAARGVDGPRRRDG